VYAALELIGHLVIERVAVDDRLSTSIAATADALPLSSRSSVSSRPGESVESSSALSSTSACRAPSVSPARALASTERSRMSTAGMDGSGCVRRMRDSSRRAPTKS